MRSLSAARAYQQSARHRDIKEQEADVFLRVNAGLRAAQGSDLITQARAVADNGRLWLMVMDLMRDGRNALPPSLRASIVSVGMTVQREVLRESPDLGFLIGINEQIAAGLSGG